MSELKLAERLKKRMKELGLSQDELASQAGCSQGAIYKILSGKTIKSRYLVDIGRVIGRSAEWLETGMETPFPSGKKENTSTESDGYICLPLSAMTAPGSPGSAPEPERIFPDISFRKDWIRSFLHANPSDLFLTYVSGDLMEPTLKDGDLILIDRSRSEIRKEGVYALLIDGELVVKRLQALPGGVLLVISDNQRYKSYEIKREETNFRIIGMVMWSGRRI